MQETTNLKLSYSIRKQVWVVFKNYTKVT